MSLVVIFKQCSGIVFFFLFCLCIVHMPSISFYFNFFFIQVWLKGCLCYSWSSHFPNERLKFCVSGEQQPDWCIPGSSIHCKDKVVEFLLITIYKFMETTHTLACKFYFSFWQKEYRQKTTKHVHWTFLECPLPKVFTGNLTSRLMLK